MSNIPADGERRAASGLHAQYRMSAALVLANLDRLESIRIADPDAGRVDDFQIILPLRLDAFQIKRSRFAGAMTFKDLIRESPDKPCLIKQLADGWQRLRATTAGRRVVVHLVTNDFPSRNDTLPAGHAPPCPAHFAAFIEQAWKPVCNSTSGQVQQVPPEWKSAWDALASASGLDAETFEGFVRDCCLDLGYRPAILDQHSVDNQPDDHDLRHVAETLFSLVADPTWIVELSRKELLEKLRWSDRFAYRSRHEFPDPQIPYRPLEQSVDRLKHALRNLPGGYIGLFGTPGSGKSTMLSRTLRELPFRLVRYYAYVPDDRTSRRLRGESLNFLHDVGLQLNDAGFWTGNVDPSSRTQLLDRFHRQLDLLHEDWENNGQATVIMIDGLDHIQREQTPERSLLDDLPDPDQVLEGVFILLGSQTDQPLPSRIRHIVSSPERRIETHPLSRAATLSIIADSELPCALTDEETNLVYERCDGHPLALAYILNLLRPLVADGSAAAILERLGRFGDTIETQYESYWDQITDQPALRALFGLLARMRGAIDLRWVRTWADAEAVHALQRTAPHYFRREADRWYFFHNSFREFLLNRTQERVPGEPNTEVDRQLYRTLAEHCAATPADSPMSWDQLHYRCLARDHDEAVRLATPRYFRDQFLACRPLDAIREDIDAALLASAEMRDAVALVRILLAGAEFQQREYHLEDTSLGLLLLAQDKHEQATAHVRDGNHLRASAGSAFEFTRQLLDRGAHEEARRVFDLAEPLQFLSGATVLDELAVRNEADDLYKWAEVAPFFLDVQHVLDAIGRVRVEATSTWNRLTADEATLVVQRRMRSHLGYGVVDKQDWNGLDKVLEGFDLQDAIDLSSWCWLVIRVCMDRAQVGDSARAQHFIRRILDAVDPATRDEEDRVLVAEWVFRILGDVEETQRWLAGLDQPETPMNLSSQPGFEPFTLRFRLNRLLYALGSDASATSLVPDLDDPKLRLTVLFERAVCKIARIWGRCWRGETMTRFEVESEARPLLRFLNLDSLQQHTRGGFWVIRSLRKDLFTLLIRAVAPHGPNALTALRNAMEQEWDAPDTEAFWSAELIRELTLTLHFHGIENAWAAQRLRTIEPLMLSGTDTGGRVNQYRAQSEAWSALAHPEETDRCLNRMLHASLGVGYSKDYQLNSWIHWLGCIIDAEPATAADRIGWFASAIQVLDERTEGGAAASACRDLLRVAFRWSPRRAVQLFSWLTKHGLMSYADGFHDLMHSALEASPAPTQIILHVFNHLYLTISLDGGTDIASLIVQETAAQAGTDTAAQAARDLLAAVERYGLPSTRRHARLEIAKALQRAAVPLSRCGLSDADMTMPDEDIPYDSKLQLDDGELTPREVSERLQSLEDLRALLAREEHDSHFEWTPIVEQLARTLEPHELNQLAELFSERSRGVRVLCAIAEQLLEKGYLDSAWDMGLRAVRASECYGWDPYSDGGSRIRAFETLVRVKPEDGRELAYKMLVQNVANDFRFPGSVVLHLERILPLIVEDVPLCEIWLEIENHVHALFENLRPAPEVAALLTQTPENDTAEAALADLLASHLDHPATAIVQAAQRALGACVHDHVAGIDRVIAESLRSDEAKQESILMVLDAVSLTDASHVSRFSVYVQSLTDSPNLCVRQAAETICSRLGITASSSSPQTRALSPVYELVLPTQRIIHMPTVQEFPIDKPIPDSDVPREMLRPFDSSLKIIAERVELDAENLYYRAAQIMRELEPAESWCAEAESRLRSIMNSTQLAFTFRRPRSVIARRAMFHVVAELVDAGRLDRGQLGLLDCVLRTYDPAMVLLEPAPRPASISPMSASGEHQIGEQEWIEAVADAFDSSPTEHSDGRIVIAEETFLRRLDTFHPTEQRQSLICDARAAHEEPGEEGNNFFHRVKQQWTSEYLSLGTSSSPSPIVIHHSGLVYDSPGDSWLALNPTIGAQLGWTLSEQKLFAWADDNGDIMVESLWWVDGALAQCRRTAAREEVGEGWLVLASEEAVKQLRVIFPEITRRQRVERDFRADAGTLRNRNLIREVSI